jgi:hypothetical protein
VKRHTPLLHLGAMLGALVLGVGPAVAEETIYQADGAKCRNPDGSIRVPEQSVIAGSHADPAPFGMLSVKNASGQHCYVFRAEVGLTAPDRRSEGCSDASIGETSNQDVAGTRDMPNCVNGR